MNGDMARFCDKLKKLRLERGLSVKKISDMLNVSESTYYNWEQGRRIPNHDVLKQLSNLFGITIDNLVYNGFETVINNLLHNNLNTIDNKNFIKVPIVNDIKFGMSIFSDEDISEYVYVMQEELVTDGIYFYLNIKEDSMIGAGISEGSRVLIKKQDYLEYDGDIMAVKVNYNEITLRRVFVEKDGLILDAENKKYRPMFFSSVEIQAGEISLIGKAIRVEQNLNIRI
jgi:repressor LexA